MSMENRGLYSDRLFSLNLVCTYIISCSLHHSMFRYLFSHLLMKSRITVPLLNIRCQFQKFIRRSMHCVVNFLISLCSLWCSQIIFIVVIAKACNTSFHSGLCFLGCHVLLHLENFSFGSLCLIPLFNCSHGCIFLNSLFQV